MPVPENGVGGGSELVPLAELDVELPLSADAARGLPRADADQVLEHVRVEDGPPQGDDPVDELQMCFENSTLLLKLVILSLLSEMN